MNIPRKHLYVCVVNSKRILMRMTGNEAILANYELRQAGLTEQWVKT